MRALALSLAAVALAGCASAPEAPVKDDSSLADVQIVTSPGGITAWLVSEPFVPIIAMEWSWEGGTAMEPPGKRGVGWVLNYMMNEGAGDMDTSAYGSRMEDLNMKFACGAWVDWTTCGMTTLKSTADDSFDMVRQAFSSLRFDEEPFERAKRELIVGLKQDESNPRQVASKTMNSTLIPGHPYAVTGTEQSVRSVTKADARAFMKQIMTKERLRIVVVGYITAEELKPKLDEVFGSLPQTSVLPAIPDAVAKPAPEKPVVKELPLPQTLVMFSGPGVKREDPDFFAAYTLNQILGGGFSSRLNSDLREKRGLTYGVATGLSVQPHFQRWSGSVSTMNDKAEEVVRLVQEHIARLGEDGPTEQELSDAKEYLTGSFPLAFDSNAKIAKNLLGFRQDGLDIDYVEKRNSFFEAVTLEDVKRVAAQYLKPENFTFVMVGKPAE